jgi:hypothetical protein
MRIYSLFLSGLLILPPVNAASAGDEQPTVPLERALNSVWGGHVHCMGLFSDDWEEHWNLKNGKVKWAQREVTWNGHEFDITGLNKSYLIEDKGRVDGSVIIADFSTGTLSQCHAELRLTR